MDMRQVHDYWQSAAKVSVDSDGLRPTARDPYLQLAIETAMERHFLPDQTLFDIGCGDGRSTIRFSKSVKRAVGFDYVADYVSSSRKAATEAKVSNIGFFHADVTDLSSVRQEHGQADVVTTIRCLVNLPEWDLQKKAIGEIARITKPGGYYILSEGWSENWLALNEQRTALGLDPMTLVPFNRLIKRSDFEAEAKKYFDIAAYENLGFYIFLSRVVQPIFVLPCQPKHTHDINRVAELILSRGIAKDVFRDVDYAGIYVMRKR